MIKRDNFKIYHTYKGILCQYLDGVNYDFENLNTLHVTMDRCRKKHPESFVWYEVINVHPCNAPNGKVYRKCRCVCDIRVIYSPHKPEQAPKPDPRNKPTAKILTVRKDDGTIRIGKYSILKSTDGDNYTVEGSKFVGTLDECKTFVEYVRKAPQCYKDRAMTKCANMDELTMRTDFGGKCILTKYTAEKKHKYDLNFRYTMHKGTAYLMY